MPEVTLYHAPPSYYFQIAPLVLAEKGVAWHSKFAAPGPPIFETYQPRPPRSGRVVRPR